MVTPAHLAHARAPAIKRSRARPLGLRQSSLPQAPAARMLVMAGLPGENALLLAGRRAHFHIHRSLPMRTLAPSISFLVLAACLAGCGKETSDTISTLLPAENALPGWVFDPTYPTQPVIKTNPYLMV